MAETIAFKFDENLFNDKIENIKKHLFQRDDKGNAKYEGVKGYNPHLWFASNVAKSVESYSKGNRTKEIFDAIVNIDTAKIDPKV